MADRTATCAVSDPSVPTTIDWNMQRLLVPGSERRIIRKLIDRQSHLLRGVDKRPPPARGARSVQLDQRDDRGGDYEDHDQDLHPDPERAHADGCQVSGSRSTP